MSKKARLRKKLLRHMKREWRTHAILEELEQDFLNLIAYGMVIKKEDKDGKVTRYYPQMV